MIRKLLFFFPLQLFLVSLKKNQLLLFIWALIFGIVSETIAKKYGLPYLFLAPEYLGKLSFWSYAIMGFAIGGFVMTFNITSYILNSKHFPFVAALKRPFLRYCINNSLWPLIFIIYYIFKVVSFHLENEHSSSTVILIYCLGILFGYTINVVFSLTYFFSTNKNIFQRLGIAPNMKELKPVNTIFSKDEKLINVLRQKQKWHVESYLFSPIKIKLARDISHYDENMLKSVIKQTHINASFFEIVIFASLLILGLFSETPFFIIPAGASIMLLFTIMFILMSAFYTWLKGWGNVVFIAFFILLNMLSKEQIFSYTNKAYGLNYDTEQAEYSLETLNELRNNKTVLNNDKKNAIAILNNWKLQNKQNNKPKLVFINTSGGGARSTLWTFYNLQLTDSLFDGQFFNQVHLISGSSGGMIGAAYFRELYLQQQKLEHSLYANFYCKNIAKDLLNPIAFSIATNDLFIRFKTFKDGENTYTKDRGYAFEQQLLANTNQVLNKRLIDYQKPEKNAIIPMMILSPTVINDGRRMLIASQPISFLTNNLALKNKNNNLLIENFEFSKLFEKQGAENLKFTSALRMSATFPYIMPSVTLPSQPQIDVMDAGMRDNYGALSTLKYIYTFKNWIDENTSGIVIINYRDKIKNRKIATNPRQSISEAFSQPVGSFYSNLFAIQDYNFDEMIQYIDNDIQQPIDIINFELENNDDEISLSWHLTTKEKEKILHSVNSSHNKKAMKRLKTLLQ